MCTPDGLIGFDVGRERLLTLFAKKSHGHFLDSDDGVFRRGALTDVFKVALNPGFFQFAQLADLSLTATLQAAQFKIVTTQTALEGEARVRAATVEADAAGVRT